MRTKLISVICVGMLSLPVCGEDTGQTKRFKTDDTTIAYTLPKGYSVKDVGGDARKAPAIFLAADNKSATINLTPLGGRVKDGMKDQAGIRALLSTFSEKYAKGSVEGKVVAKELSWSGGKGSHASFTDPRLPADKPVPAGKFRKVTIGVFQAGEEFFLMRTFHNTQDQLDQALDVVKSLKIE